MKMLKIKPKHRLYLAVGSPSHCGIEEKAPVCASAPKKLSSLTQFFIERWYLLNRRIVQFNLALCDLTQFKTIYFSSRLLRFFFFLWLSERISELKFLNGLLLCGVFVERKCRLKMNKRNKKKNNNSYLSRGINPHWTGLLKSSFHCVFTEIWSTRRCIHFKVASRTSSKDSIDFVAICAYKMKHENAI